MSILVVSLECWRCGFVAMDLQVSWDVSKRCSRSGSSLLLKSQALIVQRTFLVLSFVACSHILTLLTIQQDRFGDLLPQVLRLLVEYAPIALLDHGGHRDGCRHAASRRIKIQPFSSTSFFGHGVLMKIQPSRQHSSNYAYVFAFG